MLNSSTLQSLIQINSDNISRVQAFYISYKDFSKHAFHNGNKEVHSKYLTLAKKELAKMHLLERNQRALLEELKDVYEHEYFIRLLDVWENS
jgi:hypothetical protein